MNFIDDYIGSRYVNFKDQTFDMDKLKMDQHYFTVSTKNPDIDISKIYLYTLDKECVECPYLFIDQSEVSVSETNKLFRLATEYKEYFPQDAVSNVICDLNPKFGQYGVYNIKVDSRNSCSIEVLREAVNIYTPILTVILIHLLFFGGIYVLFLLWERWKGAQKKDDEASQSKKERVMSIDAFRGISIVIMIFANFGNGGYKFIHHAIWNGLHVADLVFPWFMWIMGACIPITLLSSFKRGVNNRDNMLNVFKRSVKLFFLGIFLNSGSNLYYIRIFGVLQRFGLCYFVVTTICMFTMNRDISLRYGDSILRYLEDILKAWKAWLVCLAVLALHTVLIFTVAAPGCPKGYMGPGGLHKNRSYEDCIGGATGYIDKLILGNHVYQNPTIYNIYEAKPFDPEGLVGCLTTIFHVMLGVQAGVTLLVFKKHHQRMVRWLIWSVFFGIIGGLLCNFSKENGVIPVNKNLWSLSFVCITSCFAFFLLSFCYFLIDVQKWWSGKPLTFAGMNAIILYIGHEMTDDHFPVRWYFSSDPDEDGRRTHFLAYFLILGQPIFGLLLVIICTKFNIFSLCSIFCKLNFALS